MAQFFQKRRVTPLLLGNALGKFLKTGGQLRYDPRRDSETGTQDWYVIAVSSDGKTELPVYTVAGEPKRFRSADAMIRYHRAMCPDDRELTIPLPKQA
jgi:hypothetical protein